MGRKVIQERRRRWIKRKYFHYTRGLKKIVVDDGLKMLCNNQVNIKVQNTWNKKITIQR